LGAQDVPNQLFHKGFKNGILGSGAPDKNDPFCRIERDRNTGQLFSSKTEIVTRGKGTA